MVPDTLDRGWKYHQKLIEEYEKWMEDCHIELGVMAHRPQLFHENLLLIRIINMSALDHETSTYDMLAIIGKIHVLRELVGSCQISLKKISLKNVILQSIKSLCSC